MDLRSNMLVKINILKDKEIDTPYFTETTSTEELFIIYETILHKIEDNQYIIQVREWASVLLYVMGLTSETVWLVRSDIIKNVERVSSLTSEKEINEFIIEIATTMLKTIKSNTYNAQCSVENENIAKKLLEIIATQDSILQKIRDIGMLVPQNMEL